MGRIGGGIATLIAIAALVAQESAVGGQDPAAEREYFASHTIQLCYDVVSGGDVEATDVELWATRDSGRSWSALEGVQMEITADGQGCLTFDLPEDGEYGLKIVAVDEDGTAEGRPTYGEAPRLIAVLDSTSPEVRIDAPEPGSWAQAGGRLSVKWSCSDAQLSLDPVEIESSADGGATWVRVAIGLPCDGERFIDLPTAETPDFRVRIRAKDRAGNAGVSTLSRGVVVRSQRPAGEPERFTSATLPPTRSSTLQFDIEYAVDDVGSAGLQSVVLWWTSDGGATWRSGGKDDDRVSPVRFRAPQDGTYGFVLQAIDNAHRASVPDPAAGAAPQRVTIVDTAAPVVALVAPVEGVLAGGAPCTVLWTASDANLGPAPVTLFWSLDGGVSWAPMCASALPNSGEFGWDVPQVVSSRVRIKVAVADLAGNVSQSASGTITLMNPSAGPPRVQIVGVRSAAPTAVAEVRTEVKPERKAEVAPETTPAKPPDPVPTKPAGDAYERGKFLRAQGKVQEARDAFREELAAHPENLDAANDLGVVLTELGDVAGAVRAFTQARRIDPSDVEVRFNLAGALLGARRPGDAIHEATETLSGLPRQGDLALRFVRLLWKAAIAALEADDLASAQQAWGAIAALDRPDNRWKDSAAEMLRRYGK